MEAGLVWVGLSVVVGWFWKRKGLSMASGIVWSLLLSPVIGFVIGLVKKADARAMEEQQLAEGGKKKCPWCAELIKGEAIVCRYCGKELPPTTLPPRAHVQTAPSDTAHSEHTSLTAQPGQGVVPVAKPVSDVRAQQRTTQSWVLPVVILGAAVVVVVMVGVRRAEGSAASARVDRAKTDVQRIASDGVEAFKVMRGRYPTPKEGLKVLLNDRSRSGNTGREPE